MDRARRLGRGLDSLITKTIETIVAPANAPGQDHAAAPRPADPPPPAPPATPAATPGRNAAATRPSGAPAAKSKTLGTPKTGATTRPAEPPARDNRSDTTMAPTKAASPGPAAERTPQPRTPGRETARSVKYTSPGTAAAEVQHPTPAGRIGAGDLALPRESGHPAGRTTPPAGTATARTGTAARTPRPAPRVVAPPADSAVPEHPGIEARMVPIARLSPNPHQPRGPIAEDSVRTLAESIRQTGILQPITVRPHGVGYQIVTGERRWRAAGLAGLAEVPVVVRKVTDEEMLELALVENIQREDLNAIDRAQAYAHYCAQFARRPEEVAGRLGEDRTTVVNFLRLLELPEAVKEMVAKGLLSAGHARSLLGLPNPEQMLLVARTVVKQGLSVRALEDLVRRTRARGGAGEPAFATAARPVKSAHLRDLETRLSLACGTKVSIEEGKRKGSGRMVIEYYSLDDFDRVAGKLGVASGE